MNAELEQKIIEHSVQLEATSKELEAFSRSASHDLNTTLRSIIEVRMAQDAVTRQPHVICSSAIGSCIVVTLYETQTRIGGLAHIMLPGISKKEMHAAPFMCAKTGIASLIKLMRGEGAEMKYIVAKIVGGAKMFSYYQNNSNIGEQNIKCAKQALRKKGIPLLGEDVGSNYGRSVEFRLDSGKLVIKAVGREERDLI